MGFSIIGFSIVTVSQLVRMLVNMYVKEDCILWLRLKHLFHL